MNLGEYNIFCEGLPHTTHVVQWGENHVWKIGGKVFAIAGDKDEEGFKATFKCSPISYEILAEQPGCRPAPYLASRGMKWIQCFSDETLSDDDLKAYLAESYKLAGATLSKKRQRELGLLPPQ